jgi:hypothetical protein
MVHTFTSGFLPCCSNRILGAFEWTRFLVSAIDIFSIIVRTLRGRYDGRR